MATTAHTRFVAGSKGSDVGGWFDWLPDHALALLLWCGILGSVFYAVINLVVPIIASGYSMKTQTVSELSAIGSPTRSLWIALIIPYGLLMIAFGFGVAKAAGKERTLRMVGALFIINSVIGFFWPPMHTRGIEPTLTDTLHIAFTIVTVFIFTLQIALASLSFNVSFAVYSIMSLLVMLVFGFLTALEAPNVPGDLPTPMIGVWERLSIGSYILWVTIFARALLSDRRTRSSA